MKSKKAKKRKIVVVESEDPEDEELEGGDQDISAKKKGPTTYVPKVDIGDSIESAPFSESDLMLTTKRSGVTGDQITERK